MLSTSHYRNAPRSTKCLSIFKDASERFSVVSFVLFELQFIWEGNMFVLKIKVAIKNSENPWGKVWPLVCSRWNLRPAERAGALHGAVASVPARH